MSQNEPPYDDFSETPRTLGARLLAFLRSGRVILALVLLVTGAFGGTYYYGYQRGLEDGRTGLPPVVLADRTPIKIPASELSGNNKKAQDLNIYDVAKGKAAPSILSAVEDITSGPADSASGAVESLLDKPKPKAVAKPAAKPIITKSKPKIIPRPKITPKIVTKSAPKPKPKAKPAPVVKSAYMVQLLSARDQTAARSNYRNLQTKYKNLLAGREPLIVKTDLGKKGIYYRVNVVGFASQADAKAFCGKLKKQGQDCLVRKQS